MTPYLICAFSRPTLSNLVKECFGSDFPDIFNKRQIKYIFKYLSDLKAASVLLEFNYIDRDYLEDFSQYYVKCFNNNGHKCARLHFFSKQIDHTSFNKLILSGVDSNGKDSKELELLKKAYLGFIVIKPLPKTFIGKTCLKRYDTFEIAKPEKNSLSREYKVDLFGISLNVHSVAFQEQDKVVSACATTAIWSALHALPERNVRYVPACSSITRNAINHIDDSSNSFPNEGLTNKQILRAFDCEKLRHYEESLAAATQDDFLNVVRYHIDSGFPLILGADVYSADESTISMKSKERGHAVTVLGYQLTDREKIIYVHDDRLGPFARATLAPLATGAFSYLTSEIKREWGIKLQEKDDAGKWKKPHEILIPNSLIIPTPRKARLPYEYAHNTCDILADLFSEWTKDVREKKYQGKGLKLQFSIKLEEIQAIRQGLAKHKYHAEIAKDPFASIKTLEKYKRDFLTASNARYQWVAYFTYLNKPAFRIYFDATDIPQGHAVSFVFVENTAVIEFIKAQIAQINWGDAEVPDNKHFIESFSKRLINDDLSIDPYENHLSATYGELRAPKYIKEVEIENGKVGSNESVQTFYDSYDGIFSKLFPSLIKDDVNSFLIWAIACDGALLIGSERGKKGHPSLTGFKPARIAGELRRTSDGLEINSKSGRYSGDYESKASFLKNAQKKFESVFFKSREKISIST